MSRDISDRQFRYGAKNTNYSQPLAHQRKPYLQSRPHPTQR